MPSVTLLSIILQSLKFLYKYFAEWHLNYVILRYKTVQLVRQDGEELSSLRVCVCIRGGVPLAGR